jgi:hypothetical protein
MYPPKPKLTKAVSTRNSPDNSAKVLDVSLHVGAVEETPRPRDAPNAIRRRESAAAISAPAITGVQCTKSVRISTGVVVTIRAEVSMTMILIGLRRQRRPKNERMNKITTIKPIR